MKDPSGSSGSDETSLGAGRAAADLGGELRPGAVVGEYRIERELGRGGMGRVYAARHPVIGKRAAIKVLRESLSGDPAVVRRFVDEARAVNKIGHPNIIDIFAFGQLPDGRQYFVMEYLDGETLAARLARGPMALAEAGPLLAQAARALEAAHRENIVHRDLKPDNMWIARPKHGQSFMKVLDFGIAKLLERTEALNVTETGMVLGTPLYMAPEQCLGHNVDHRADVYAFGVILYRVFGGRLPFEGKTFVELMAQQLSVTPPRPSSLRPLPHALDELVVACLEKEAARRPQTAAEVADRLEASLAGQPDEGGEGQRGPKRDDRSGTERGFESNRSEARKALAPARSRRVDIVAAVLVLALAAGAVAVLARQRLRGPRPSDPGPAMASPAPAAAPAPAAPVAAPVAAPAAPAASAASPVAAPAAAAPPPAAAPASAPPAAPATPASPHPPATPYAPAAPPRGREHKPEAPPGSRADRQGLIKDNPFR